MSAQPLFEPGPPTIALTIRQQFVLDAVRASGFDGLDADEVGARLHERRGKHDAGVRCSWCASDGQDVLRALRKKDLVRRRRGGTWVALSEPGDGGDASSGASPGAESASDAGEIPF